MLVIQLQLCSTVNVYLYFFTFPINVSVSTYYEYEVRNWYSRLSLLSMNLSKQDHRQSTHCCRCEVVNNVLLFMALLSACSQSLGISDGGVMDSQMDASSMFKASNTYYPPSAARLNNAGELGWKAASTAAGQWLEV